MTIVTINGHRVDMAASAASPSSAQPSDDDGHVAQHRIVITTVDAFGSLKLDQRQDLQDKECYIEEFVGPTGYICQYRGEPEVIEKLDYISEAQSLPSYVAVDKALHDKMNEKKKQSNDPESRVHISLYDGSTLNTELKEAIAEKANVKVTDLEEDAGIITVTMKEKNLKHVAKIEDVRCIHETYSRQTLENKGEETITGPPAIGDTEYKGKGQVIAIADTGLDRNHSAFVGKQPTLISLGRNEAAKTDDPHGHGTHVCGSAVGKIQSAQYGNISAPACEADLVMQSCFVTNNSSLGGIPQHLRDLFDPPYQRYGARIHSNSWGKRWTGIEHSYLLESGGETDDFVMNHPEMVICFAAGNNTNQEHPERTLCSEAMAKNCITVGASAIEHKQNDRYTYGESWSSDLQQQLICSDGIADNREGMAAFSSRGPTPDGRFKPDIVAPGSCILSCLSQDVDPDNINHKCCVSADSTLFYDSGTSMATPLVASCCAALRDALLRNGVEEPEALTKNGVKEPKAALIKALLINGAVPLTEATLVPNNHSGFGRVSLKNSITNITDKKLGGYWVASVKDTEKDYSRDIAIPDTGIEKLQLKVTLVYNDPGGRELQYNLNLVVRVDNGEEYHGNKKNPDGKMIDYRSKAKSPTHYDTENNVEQVIWENISARKVTICVEGNRLFRPGARGSDVGVSVEFAVVWQLMKGQPFSST